MLVQYSVSKREYISSYNYTLIVAVMQPKTSVISSIHRLFEQYSAH